MSFKTIALTAATAAAFALPVSSAHAAPALKGKLAIERSGDAKLIKVVKRNRRGVRPFGNLRTPGINRRLNRQRNRIRNARRNGRLTFGEARRVRKGLKRVRRALHIARFDGHVSRFERRKLHNMLDRNGRKIRRLANNGRFANGHRRKPGASLYLSF
ncbi:MAG: hypothetical protein AAGJ70_11100 [Pseudomonadota bacterium]